MVTVNDKKWAEGYQAGITGQQRDESLSQWEQRGAAWLHGWDVGRIQFYRKVPAAGVLPVYPDEDE